MKEVYLRLGEGVAGTVAQRRQGMIVKDYQTSPYAMRIFKEYGITAILAGPLLYHDRLLGVIVLGQQETARSFTAADRECLALFAVQAAVAIENARLYAETERRQREAELIATLATDIHASPDLDIVLQRVAEGAQELCASDMASIALRGPQLGGDRRALPDWRTRATVQRLPHRSRQGHRGTGAPDRTPLPDGVLCRRPTRKQGRPGVARRGGPVAALVVPIRLGDCLEGVLYVANRSPRPFTDNDQAILLRLAAQAS